MGCALPLPLLWLQLLLLLLLHICIPGRLLGGRGAVTRGGGLRGSGSEGRRQAQAAAAQNERSGLGHRCPQRAAAEPRREGARSGCKGLGRPPQVLLGVLFASGRFFGLSQAEFLQGRKRGTEGCNARRLVSVCLVSPSVCLSAHRPVYLSVHLFVCPSICPCACLSI